MLAVITVLAGLLGAPAWAVGVGGFVQSLRPHHPLLAKALEQIFDPWFFFGMTAQFVFFMRFVVQWITSERRKRSTVPVSFWYLSLVGSLALFVYAFHRWDFVIMSGQALACLIYVRNLMLISDSRKRRRQAGLPTSNARNEVEPGGMAANEPPR